jgi:hypothetical protein
VLSTQLDLLAQPNSLSRSVALNLLGTAGIAGRNIARIGKHWPERARHTP